MKPMSAEAIKRFIEIGFFGQGKSVLEIKEDMSCKVNGIDYT